MGTRQRVDGYRYVCEQRRWYCPECGKRADISRCQCQHETDLRLLHSWALYEVRNGRACRVGTARSEGEYREWLGLSSELNSKRSSEVAK